MSFDPDAADLYDLRTESIRQDLPLILDLARSYGPEILELGCGTGRVLRALEAAGFAPVGVDSSEEAVAVARRRSPALHIEVQAMQRLNLARMFGLVLIPFNTFEMLLTVEDRLAALSHAHSHCRPGALLYIDTRPMTFEAGEFAPEEPLRLIRTLQGPKGERIQVLFGARRDTRRRLSTSRMVYRWQGADGAECEVVDEYRVSPVTADELLLSVRLSGFTVVGWYGSYEREPFDPLRHTQLVALARPSA